MNGVEGVEVFPQSREKVRDAVYSALDLKAHIFRARTVSINPYTYGLEAGKYICVVQFIRI